MSLRRAFLWWQFAAVLVLPTAVFFSRGVFGERLGWDLLVAALTAPVLGIALLVVALVILVRPSVLVSRAVSWFDMAVMSAWHAAIIWLCVTPSAWLVVAVIALALLAFWGALWQFVTDGARRIRTATRDFTARFESATGVRRPSGPIDLGELRPIDDPAEGAVAASGRTVAE
ncbi:MAG TPA: hypothetical protein VNQ48_02530 [Microbacteriaceae bacterium]|nr:hypothetical protein [Microbacteriaceae bacterium]